MDIWDAVSHHYADSDGTKIHYAAAGEGDAVLFVHGFPDFWYSWRHQMSALAPHFRVAAMDTRGYNLSDKPTDVSDYAMERLHEDISAVIDDLGGQPVTLVGHDWGGAICWQYALSKRGAQGKAHRERISKLVIMNLTHPKGYAAVVANPTPAQAENVAYAKRFAGSTPGDDQVPEQVLNAGDRRGDDPEVAARYRAAFEQSSWNGMMNYYRANYGSLIGSSGSKAFDGNVDRPVLQFHGLQDTAVDKDGLRDTWNWIGSDYTLVTVPDAGHFVQWDAAALVSETMKWWLLARR